MTGKDGAAKFCHVDTDTLILPAHFPGETAGRIRDAGGEWRFEFDE